MLPVVRCAMFAVRCALLGGCCTLRVVACLLLPLLPVLCVVVRCALRVVCYLMFDVGR